MPNSIPEQAEKLKKKWAIGMTDYFMRELKDVLPVEQHEIVRSKLYEKFKKRATEQVGKKWMEEMAAKSLEA